MPQRKAKYHDKNYIMNCMMPSQLFTVKGIKGEYRALAKIWHPDVSDVKEALFIMSKINALYNEGQLLISENRFYEKERILNRNRHKDAYEKDKMAAADWHTSFAGEDTARSNVQKDPFKRAPQKRSKKKRTIELIATSGKCIRFKYLKRVMIELGFMYVSETYIMLEITKLKLKIFLDSLHIVEEQPENYFHISTPQLIDSFETTSHGYLVFKKERGIEPIVVLETVMGYLKPLGCRKICEGLFYDLTALKHQGLTSTGLDKDLWFIDVNTGKLYNFGLFFYLHEFSSKLSRAPSEITDILNALQPKDNESMIIDLVKKAIMALSVKSGLKKDDFYCWLEALGSDSLEASLAESQVFNRSIASVTTHGFDLDSYYRAISYS
ncbi:J domain-containing protein [Fusibacter paucivorans]|uniref:J domain-containing protein n=1 Tax=Fusibacter paucivorans TaxID=76009 RepID=A0ABS5PKQ3_9FIRM|nr:J domain-containing protein [Fusibacter paucivorans]MBS7525442.1 J domain-containing protein [Fusibacter paucivorans]